MSSKKNSKIKENKKFDFNKNIDLLDEDKPIAGQKFVCLSFISPEDIIKNKEMFLFEKFLNKFEINKSIEKFENFVNFICH